MTVEEFNPFDKPISDLSPGDLYSLDSLEEGYYIDYKADLIDRADIANSVCSFANTYGGILFFGISEDEENNTPDEYFLLDKGDSLKLKEKLRQIINSRVNPSPQFTSYAISDSTGTVIALEIPESVETPHITNSGRIYRRTGEIDTPYKEVEDIEILDRLYARREKWQDSVRDFYQIPIALRGDHPLLEMYAAPSTLGQKVCSNVMGDVEKFREIVEEKNFEINVPTSEGDIDKKSGSFSPKRFDTFRTTSNGIIAQRWHTEVHPKRRPTTLVFQSDGGLKVLQRLPVGNFSSEIADKIEEILEVRDRYLTKINGSSLLPEIYRYLSTYIDLLEEYQWLSEASRRLYFNFRFRNIQQCALVFDYNAYSEFFDSQGVPITFEDTVEVPQYDPIRVSAKELSDEDSTTIYNMSRELMTGLGLFPDRFDTMMQNTESYPTKVFHT